MSVAREQEGDRAAVALVHDDRARVAGETERLVPLADDLDRIVKHRYSRVRLRPIVDLHAVDMDRCDDPVGDAGRSSRFCHLHAGQWRVESRVIIGDAEDSAAVYLRQIGDLRDRCVEQIDETFEARRRETHREEVAKGGKDIVLRSQSSSIPSFSSEAKSLGEGCVLA